FLLSGLYTHPAAYQGSRALALFRGVALSLLLFSITSFALYRRQSMPQSFIPLFCGLAVFSLALPRIAKSILQQRVGTKPRGLARRNSPPATVLILGGAGYIGSCLVRKLLAAGRKV